MSTGKQKVGPGFAEAVYLAQAKFVHWQIWSSFEESCKDSVTLALESDGRVEVKCEPCQGLSWIIHTSFSIAKLHAQSLLHVHSSYKTSQTYQVCFFCLRCQVGWSISRHKNHYVFAGKAATLGMLRWTFGAHFWSGRWCEENRPAPLCALTSRCDLMMVKDCWGEFSHCSLLVTGQWWSAKY